MKICRIFKENIITSSANTFYFLILSKHERLVRVAKGEDVEHNYMVGFLSKSVLYDSKYGGNILWNSL